MNFDWFHYTQVEESDNHALFFECKRRHFSINNTTATRPRHKHSTGSTVLLLGLAQPEEQPRLLQQLSRFYVLPFPRKKNLDTLQLERPTYIITNFGTFFLKTFLWCKIFSAQQLEARMKIGPHLWKSYHGCPVTACWGAAHGQPAVSRYVTWWYGTCKIMAHCFIACSYLYSIVYGQRYRPALKQYVVRVMILCAASGYSNTLNYMGPPQNTVKSVVLTVVKMLR